MPALVAALLLAGCAQNISPNNYNVQAVGDVDRVVPGVLVAARPVQVSGNKHRNGRSGGGLWQRCGSPRIGAGGTRAGILGAVGGA